MTIYPKLVANLVTNFNAWITGSAANPETDLKTVRDWDIIVPFSEWVKAASCIPMNAVPNRFGGWKCISERQEVDVWPDDLTNIMPQRATNYLWHPRTNMRWKKL